MNDETREVKTIDAGTMAILHSSEIDTQITTARKYPRSLKRIRDELLELTTLTEQVAKECVYALPRKQNGKHVMIEGPSARFAEILAHSWGNARAGARVIDDTGDFVTAQGAFHDLEKNVAITYEVKRRITNKDGYRFSADMIATTSNAACSIALRNAVLKGVPKALWVDAYNAAREVIMGSAQTLNTRRAHALQTMQKFGLNAEQVCLVMGVPGVDDIGLEELVGLHGLCGALRDGETTIERLLEESGTEPPTRAAAISRRLRGGAAKEETPPPAPPVLEEPPRNNESSREDHAYADRVIMVQDCEDVDQLNHVAAIDMSIFTENQIKLLLAAIDKKRKALTAEPKP